MGKTTSGVTQTVDNKAKMNSINVKEILSKCVSLKPRTLIIDDIKWKYAIRSAVRGKNILFVGPTGCGKTLTAKSVAGALNNRAFYYFNLGAMQDARSSLIGNTHFDKKTGTLFSAAEFVDAIRTENAIILLDELSRAHHDAVNILMTVLDDLQRYIRLDEEKEHSIVKVANGVTFLATANVGNEYTATRVMDRALLDRFPIKIEMGPMSMEDEYKFLQEKFTINEQSELHSLKSICEIAEHTRVHIKQDDSKLTNFISTRSTVEMSELITDGFSLMEIAEAAIYPNFSEDGGIDSERTYIKQLVQKYILVEGTSVVFQDPIRSKDQPPF